MEEVSKSNAHLIAARLHLRAGRYKEMYKNIRKAWAKNPASLFTIRMFKLIGNGILFRLKRVLA